MDFKNIFTTVVVMTFMFSILAGVMLLNVMKYGGGI
jgi:hypothetical protein